MDEQKLIESLSINESKILPYLHEKNIGKISKESGLDRTSVLRALEYLEKKGVAKISRKKNKVVDLGINGVLYRKKGLPERTLFGIVKEKKILLPPEAKKLSNLSDEEFKAAIGALKRKGLIEMKNGKLTLGEKISEFSKKTEEEIFLESLPVGHSSLSKKQLETFKELEKRKDIVKIRGESIISVEVTELGKKIIALKPNDKMIEQVTPKILEKDSYWKGKKFRRYDVTSELPEIHGGKRHFVHQASDYARRVWTDMGFREMTGNTIQSSFWNFDALFTAQDHPVREMQDTFFLNEKGKLPERKIVRNVRDSHEGKIKGSKGWNYSWNEEEAKTMVLRTHTTVLSAQTLASLEVKKLPAKFFALGKCFRNETIDWKHGFEFNQTEGIVVDKNANFRHLLGYLKQFFNKMGFEKIRFGRAYFPYTEPSVEVDVFHEGKKEWLELGGAGMFRPEVVIPLLGENIPVLAWGPGFDRILMDHYKITDIRELYKNDISQLRKIKFWMKT